MRCNFTASTFSWFISAIYIGKIKGIDITDSSKLLPRPSIYVVIW